MIEIIDKEPFEKMSRLLEKLTSQMNSCSGDKCPQFNQLKVKQNLFMTIAGAFVAVLIGISTMAHIELKSFKEQIHSSEINVVGKRADLSRQVYELKNDVNELCNHVKNNNAQLNRLEVDVERLKVKFQQ
jgi:uncharacterized protein YlxW (UPF0749 family)